MRFKPRLKTEIMGVTDWRAMSWLTRLLSNRHGTVMTDHDTVSAFLQLQRTAGNRKYTARPSINYNLNLRRPPKSKADNTYIASQAATAASAVFFCNYRDYYSFTDRGWMEGWVGLVSWPISDTLPTKLSPLYQAWIREKSASQRTAS